MLINFYLVTLKLVNQFNQLKITIFIFIHLHHHITKLDKLFQQLKTRNKCEYNKK